MPGMIRGGAKPQWGRASRGEAAAKAVRTATKLSHKVTERYGAGFQRAKGNKSRVKTYPGGDPACNVTTSTMLATVQATRLYGTDRRPAFRRTSSSGPSKNSVQASAAAAGLPNKCRQTSKQSTPPASFPAQCARALDHFQSFAFLVI